MYDRGHRVTRARSPVPAPSSPSSTRRSSTSPSRTSRPPSRGRAGTLLSWVLDGYFVVIAALLVPAGGLADRFGHKRVFLLGLGRLHRSPACSARSRPRSRLLIAFRVLQGVGAAMIAPTSLAIVLDSFPTETRARPGSASGARRPRPRRRPGRPSAAPWSNSPTGAWSSSSTCRSAPRSCSPAGAACPSGRSRDSRLPDLPGALMLALGLAAGDAGDRRGQRLGLDRAGDARLPSPPAALLLGGVVVRSRATRGRSSSRRSSPTAPSASATSAPCSSPPPSSR